jgi:hypothetical protein
MHTNGPTLSSICLPSGCLVGRRCSISNSHGKPRISPTVERSLRRNQSVFAARRSCQLSGADGRGRWQIGGSVAHSSPIQAHRSPHVAFSLTFSCAEICTWMPCDRHTMPLRRHYLEGLVTVTGRAGSSPVSRTREALAHPSGLRWLGTAFFCFAHDENQGSLQAPHSTWARPRSTAERGRRESSV